MTVRVDINGFGRIERNMLRIVEYGRKDVTVAAISGVGGATTNVAPLKCDSAAFRGMIAAGFCRMCDTAVARQAAPGHE